MTQSDEKDWEPNQSRPAPWYMSLNSDVLALFILTPEGWNIQTRRKKTESERKRKRKLNSDDVVVLFFWCRASNTNTECHTFSLFFLFPHKNNIGNHMRGVKTEACRTELNRFLRCTRLSSMTSFEEKKTRRNRTRAKDGAFDDASLKWKQSSLKYCKESGLFLSYLWFIWSKHYYQEEESTDCSTAT